MNVYQEVKLDEESIMTSWLQERLYINEETDSENSSNESTLVSLSIGEWEMDDNNNEQELMPAKQRILPAPRNVIHAISPRNTLAPLLLNDRMTIASRTGHQGIASTITAPGRSLSSSQKEIKSECPNQGNQDAQISAHMMVVDRNNNLINVGIQKTHTSVRETTFDREYANDRILKRQLSRIMKVQLEGIQGVVPAHVLLTNSVNEQHYQGLYLFPEFDDLSLLQEYYYERIDANRSGFPECSSQHQK